MAQVTPTPFRLALLKTGVIRWPDPAVLHQIAPNCQLRKALNSQGAPCLSPPPELPSSARRVGFLWVEGGNC